MPQQLAQILIEPPPSVPRAVRLGLWATDAHARDPAPAAPRGNGPQAKTCCLSASSWLHLLKSWSIRRGGSVFHRSSPLRRPVVEPPLSSALLSRVARVGRSDCRLTESLKERFRSAAAGLRP